MHTSDNCELLSKLRLPLATWMNSPETQVLLDNVHSAGSYPHNGSRPPAKVSLKTCPQPEGQLLIILG